jgi:heme/copper-type cytochrome/quinol oxidase subunit 2
MINRQDQERQDRRTTIYAMAIVSVVVGLVFIAFMWTMIGAVGHAADRPCITGTPAYQQQLNCGSK